MHVRRRSDIPVFIQSDVFFPNQEKVNLEWTEFSHQCRTSGGNQPVNATISRTGLSQLYHKCWSGHDQTQDLDVIQKLVLKLSECQRANAYHSGTRLTICHLLKPAVQLVLNMLVRVVRKHSAGSQLPLWHRRTVTSQQSVTRFPGSLTSDAATWALFEATIPPWARWSQGLSTHKDVEPRRKPILKHWSFPPPSSLSTLFYNFCGVFARGLGCHYAVHCLGLQAFALWFAQMDAFLKKWRYETRFNPLCLNTRCGGL